MKIDHVAINVKNIEKSVSWYKNNFPVEILYQDETWAMMAVGETKLALTIADQHPPHIAFCVENFDTNDIVKEHRDGSKYVYKTDPDGNILELLSYD
jgi:catechol 2,3-dioxygenase-like lactoylglutathione lyase family enzyme